MLPDAGGADEDRDEADATDAVEAVDAAERVDSTDWVDCTDWVEREDCDMEEATESAYVVSE